jgi:hypothetical protein
MKQKMKEQELIKFLLEKNNNNNNNNNKILIHSFLDKFHFVVVVVVFSAGVEYGF